MFHRDVVGAIGRTPLIRLRAASEATGCTILGKAEFMNPGGSVKDRAALAIIRDAIARGALRPGGVIVEGTAGNTGIGIAMVAGALGFRSVIVIPNTQSQEKKDMLRLAGAELVEVPAVPYSNPNNYVRYSGRLAEALARTERGGAVWANQFDNVANRRGHYETTGPEIFEQTDGKVDAFVSAVGCALLALFVVQGNVKGDVGKTLAAALVYMLPLLALQAVTEKTLRRWADASRFPVDWVVYGGAKLVLGLAAAAVGSAAPRAKATAEAPAARTGLACVPSAKPSSSRAWALSASLAINCSATSRASSGASPRST